MGLFYLCLSLAVLANAQSAETDPVQPTDPLDAPPCDFSRPFFSLEPCTFFVLDKEITFTLKTPKRGYNEFNPQFILMWYSTVEMQYVKTPFSLEIDLPGTILPPKVWSGEEAWANNFYNNSQNETVALAEMEIWPLSCAWRDSMVAHDGQKVIVTITPRLSILSKPVKVMQNGKWECVIRFLFYHHPPHHLHAVNG